METLTNEINAATIAKYKAEQAALQELMDLEADRVNNQIIASAKLLDDFYNTQLNAQDREKNAIIDKWNFAIEAEEKGSAKRIELEEAMQSELAAIDAKYKPSDTEIIKKSARTFEEMSKNEVKWAEMTAEEKMNIMSSTAGSLAKILGEETAAGKSAAIIQATIDTYQSANASYKSLSGIPVVGPVLGGIAAAAAVASGIANVKAIASTGGGGGGGSVSATTPTASAVPPAPQMMSGAFQLEGGQEVEPQRAYVVSDDITDSQNGLAIIRRRATI